jgi:hypothetical protein
MAAAVAAVSSAQPSPSSSSANGGAVPSASTSTLPPLEQLLKKSVLRTRALFNYNDPLLLSESDSNEACVCYRLQLFASARADFYRTNWLEILGHFPCDMPFPAQKPVFQAS